MMLVGSIAQVRNVEQHSACDARLLTEPYGCTCKTRCQVLLVQEDDMSLKATDGRAQQDQTWH